MRLVNAVPAVNICADGVPLVLSLAEVLECLVLMSGGVGAEDGGGVDVVGVCAGAAGVVGREAEDVEVLRCAGDRVEGDVIGEEGGGEDRFDDPAGDADGMVGGVVKAAADEGGYGRGQVGGVVEGVGALFEGDGPGSWVCCSVRGGLRGVLAFKWPCVRYIERSLGLFTSRLLCSLLRTGSIFALSRRLCACPLSRNDNGFWEGWLEHSRSQPGSSGCADTKPGGQEPHAGEVLSCSHPPLKFNERETLGSGLSLMLM